jgi:thymidine kinase
MSLEVLIGPMFAGKSSALMSTIRRYEALGWNVFVLTHSSDTRYSETPHIVSHDRQTKPAHPCTLLTPMLEHCEYAESKLVVVEEGQFFPDLEDFVRRVVDKDKKHCVVVGLDGDAKRRPFGSMLNLIPLADKVEKLTALCKRCGDGTPALFSAAISAEAATAAVAGAVCVGAEERYAPLCRRHYLESEEAATVRPGGPQGTVRPGGPQGTVRPGGPPASVRPGGPQGTVRPGGPQGTVRPGGLPVFNVPEGVYGC